MGDGEKASLRLQFNPKVRLAFHGATITTDAGLLAFREFDDALGLTEIAEDYPPGKPYRTQYPPPPGSAAKTVDLQPPSITTTVQGGMSGDVRRAARRLAWERLARSLHSCVSSSQRSSSFGPNRSRGSISPHHPVDLGPGDPGHLSPPQSCCRLRRKAPASRHRATW